MSAVAFCASIYMTLAVTVHCQKYSRTKSNRQSSCIQLTKIVQRLNGTLLCAGPTSTGQLAWLWQTPDACWSTSSQSPPSPLPSTSPSSWRWQWLSTMEQTRLTLPRQERIQPSFSGEIYKFIYTSTFNAWQITGGIHSTRPKMESVSSLARYTLSLMWHPTLTTGVLPFLGLLYMNSHIFFTIRLFFTK